MEHYEYEVSINGMAALTVHDFDFLRFILPKLCEDNVIKVTPFTINAAGGREYVRAGGVCCASEN